MPKLILLIISIAMVGGGLHILTAELLWAGTMHFLLVIGAAMLVAIGAYLLWDHFLGPMLSVQRKD